MTEFLDNSKGRAVRALIACLVGATFAVSAGAQDTTVTTGVRIGLTFDRNARPGVVITPVSGPNADSVQRILARDLDFSDRVSVIPIDSGDPVTGALNYPLYAKMGGVAIVQASVTPAGALHVAIHDIGQKRVALVMDAPLPSPALSGAWRAVIHAAADTAEWVLFGQKGIASTRVAFARRGQLYTVDADGANVTPLTGGANGLSPAWHPSGKKIAFDLMPDDGRHRIVVQDLVTSQRLQAGVGSLNITPAWSPDGSKLVFASGNDATDLYTWTPGGTDSPRRLTSRRGSSNASPTFSPDGQRVAFTSGLLGHPEVYIVDADGTGDELLTDTGSGELLYRSNPSWSPDGRNIAYQSRLNGEFQLVVKSVRDRSERQITNDGANEKPSWAPDSRHLVFVSTRTGSPELWVMDIESARARQLTHGGKVQMPAWSPRLDLPR